MSDAAKNAGNTTIKGKPYEQIPKAKGLPLIGSAKDLFVDPLDFFSEANKQYGDIHRIQLLNQEMICVHSSDLLVEILLKDAKSYNKSKRALDITYPALGESLGTTLDMTYWARLRGMLQPLFTPKMIASYFDGTRNAVEHDLELLDEAHHEKKVVELHSFSREASFYAMAHTLFKRGIEADEIPELIKHYNHVLPYLTVRAFLRDSPLAGLLPAARRGRQAVKFINARIDKLINERRSESLDEPQDMLDAMMMAKDENGVGLTDEAIHHNVMMLFVSGQSTTPSTITWAFGLLAENPDKRTKMLDEIDRVLQGRKPEFEDLHQLKYTDRVIEETLRLYPVNTYLERQAIKDTELGGYEIKTGTSLFLVPYTIHRDSKYWPEPHAFIPERHTEEAKKTRPKYTTSSFGYGQRRCIGERAGRLEAVLTLVMVSQKYLLEHSSGYMPKIDARLTPIPKGGMPMKIIAR